MGYYVRILRPLLKPAHRKLQFASDKLKRAITSTAKKPKKEWDISKARWYALGFQPKMTVEQARARAQQLNARLHTKHQEERSANQTLRRPKRFHRPHSV